MNIEKQLQDDHSVKLIVEIEQEKMDTYKRRAARKISERGKIPGFRPGKAPYDMVVRSFGESAVTEQAIDLLIDAEYSNILKEADVDPGASGSLENVDSLTPPKFTFRVPLAPSVDLGDYKSVRMDYEWIVPDEEKVESSLQELRRMYATTETVERAVEVGDYLLIDVKSETEELNRAGFAAFVREEDRDTEWPFSGFAKKLVGLNKDEAKTIKHSFPADWEVTELQGKDVELEVTVKTVRSTTLPEVDDEFAKMTGAGETVEAMREALKKDVEARSRAEYDDKFFVELIEKIKAGATIKYNEHTVEHESEHVLEDLRGRLSQQGMDFDTYLKVRSTTLEQFKKDEVEPVAKKRLERSLILDEIVKQEKVEIDNSQLDAEFSNVLNSYAMQGVNVRGRNKKEQQQITQSLVMQSANTLITRGALDILKSIAIGEYKTPEERQTAKEAQKALEAESGTKTEEEAGAA